MPGATFLEGETVELCTLEPEDAETLQRFVNDPRVRRGILRSEPVTLPEEREWVEEPDEDGVHLGICVDGDVAGVAAGREDDSSDDSHGAAGVADEREPDTSDDTQDAGGADEREDDADRDGGAAPTLVGTVSLKTDHDGHRTAEVGYLVDPVAWGDGYATDALETICGYAFAERGLAKVVGRAYETNPASRRVLEKVGFVEEGVLRAEVHVDGERVDVHRYGLLREE